MMTPRKLQSLSNDEKTKDFRILCLNYAFQSKAITKPGFKRMNSQITMPSMKKILNAMIQKEKTEICIFIGKHEIQMKKISQKVALFSLYYCKVSSLEPELIVRIRVFKCDLFLKSNQIKFSTDVQHSYSQELS